jgi:hypothetical protein
MSQPPYRPQGGNDPESEQPGSSGWNPPAGANDPTQRFGAPGELQREQTQQFGQPQYGRPGEYPYGQPQYGQQSGPPLYGPPAQPQYGQSAPPQYGQFGYGQPGQHGQAPYGQPGQPPYGQPGTPWGVPGGPAGQRPKGRKNTLVALIIAAVVVLAAIGVALYLVLGNTDATTRNGSATTAQGSSASPADGLPPATVAPDGLGDDPVLDEYAANCYDGDMRACDTLYDQSDVGSTYEAYGGTCAGRQPIRDSDVVYCTDAFPA